MIVQDKTKVLVLGGGGFIGHHTVGALLKAGYPVRVLDVYRPDDVDASVDWHFGASHDRNLLRAALEGVGQVIDLAASGKPGVRPDSLSSDVAHALALTIETAEICKAAGVTRFIFPSSGGTVYGINDADTLSEDACCRPINAYGAGKLAAEHYLRLLGGPDFRVVALRVSNPFGEGQRPMLGQGFVAAVFDAAKRQVPLEIWGNGDTVRDFIYVGDVADAFVASLTYEGAATLFNVGSGKGRDLNEVMSIILEETGVDVTRAYVAGRKIDVTRNVLDISLAEKELNWKPRTDFRAGIRQTAKWWDR